MTKAQNGKTTLSNGIGLNKKSSLSMLLGSALAWSALTGASIAQDTPTPKSDPIAALLTDGAPQEETVETATPPLWRVSDADSTFWLFGTFHILPPDLEWRTPALTAILEEADTYYFEVEGDAPDTQSRTLRILMTEGFNPPGKMLTGMLEQEDADKLLDIANELGLPMAAIDPMRPWQAFLALSVQFIVNQGFEPGKGADNVLMGEGRARGKNLKFFETLEEQMEFFTGLSSSAEKDLLVLTIRDWENQKNAFDDLYDSWRRGDVSVIDDAMNASMRDQAPKLFDVLITKRNKRWAETIAADMRAGAGDALIAVGAAHMAGDNGSLPALLLAEGFTVTRMEHDETNVFAASAAADAAPNIAAANDNAPVNLSQEVEGIADDMEDAASDSAQEIAPTLLVNDPAETPDQPDNTEDGANEVNDSGASDDEDAAEEMANAEDEEAEETP